MPGKIQITQPVQRAYCHYFAETLNRCSIVRSGLKNFTFSLTQMLESGREAWSGTWHGWASFAMTINNITNF